MYVGIYYVLYGCGNQKYIVFAHFASLHFEVGWLIVDAHMYTLCLSWTRSCFDCMNLNLNY